MIDNLCRAMGRFNKRFSSGGVILMYHRVADKDVDPWLLCVSPQHFAQQMEVLQKHATPLSLEQLVRAHQQRHIPSRAVIVTFDDGYSNNLHNAKPLLERYNIPATVFLATGYVGKDREFWWDELEQLLLHPGSLPQELCIQANGTTFKWMLGASVDYSEADYLRDYSRHAAEADPGSRLGFYYSVWLHLQPLPDGQRWEAMDQISAWAGVKPAARGTHRPVTFDELSRLELGELLELGAHSVTHPMLSTFTLASQSDEIRKCKADLENVLGHPVQSFAYPFGSYSKETVALVRTAGFSRACSTAEERVLWHSDLFQLPRFAVKDWDGDEFQKRLFGWLEC